MKNELIVQKDPKSPISEIFRTLRTNMQFMNNREKFQTILVTSTLPGEGKSWVSANLAVTFAQANKRVILIDADMRRGKQHMLFGVAPRPGLSNFLAKADSRDNEGNAKYIKKYIQETEIENLSLIAAGNVPPNPSELLVSPQMEFLLEQLKEMFDVIIFDGTPNQLVTDALIISRLVSSTIIVTACKTTKKEDLKKVIENIKNVGGNIAGVVLNKVPMSSKKYEQRYYYGSTTAMSVQKKSGKSDKRTHASENRSSANSKSKRVQAENEPRGISVEQLVHERRMEQKVNTEPKKVENSEVNSAEDILKQISEYLEKEKKDLNEKRNNQ